MSLKTVGTIEIPSSTGSSFDHGAFDPKSRRIFVAHTGRDSVEVIDHDTRRHVATVRTGSISITSAAGFTSPATTRSWSR